MTILLLLLVSLSAVFCYQVCKMVVRKMRVMDVWGESEFVGGVWPERCRNGARVMQGSATVPSRG